MNVLSLQIFVSLMLVSGAVLLFICSVRGRDFEHADRLSLAPLEDEASGSLPPHRDSSRAKTE